MSLFDSVCLSKEQFLRIVLRAYTPEFPFKNRRPTENLSASWNDVWLFMKEIYEGTFIDNKFSNDWLTYHGIQRDLLEGYKGNEEKISDIFYDAIQYTTRFKSPVDDVAKWMYNPSTRRSGFVLACSYNDQAAFDFLVSRGIPTDLLANLIDDGTPLILPLLRLVRWYDDNREALYYIHYGSWWFTPFTSVSVFIGHYVKFVQKHATKLEPYMFSPGSKTWFDFGKYAKDRWGITLQWTAQQFIDARAGVSDVKVSSTGVKPAKYALWTIEERFKWDLQNDKMFTARLTHTDPELVAKWEEFKHNWDEMKIWLDERK